MKRNRIIILVLAMEMVVMLAALLKFSRASFADDNLPGGELSVVIDGETTKYEYERIVPRGIYQIDVLYEQGEIEDGQSSCFVINTDNGKLLSDLTPLFYYTNRSNFRFYADDSTNPIRVTCQTADNNIGTTIDSVNIKRLDGISLIWRMMKLAFVISLLDGVILYAIYLYKSDSAKRKKSIYLLGIILTSIYPILIVKTGWGDDIRDHLVRLKYISDELSEGHFPIRMASGLYNGYGYPFNVFYPYLLYLIPALLHLAGMPLYMAYESYMIIVCVITVLICYYSFRVMAGNDLVGIWGAAIYTLAIWRFTDCFNRGAVGEYTALAFIPLLFLAMYRFSQDRENKYRAEVEFVVAYTMLFQSHMLTTVICTLILGIVFVIFLKELFCLDNIVRVIRMGILTFLVNSWYLIPLGDWYRKYDLVLKSEAKIRENGAVRLAEMISYNMIYYDDTGRLVNELPRNPGVVLFIILFVCMCWLYTNRKKNIANKKWIYTSLVLALINLWMISDKFPYAFFENNLSYLYKILNSVQFTMRYNTYVLIFVIIAGVMVAGNMDRKQVSFAVYIAITCTATVVSWMALTDNYVSLNSLYPSLDASRFGSYPYDSLYLIKGTAKEETETHELYMSQGIEARRIYGENEYEYEVVSSTDGDGYFDADILMYDGYEALATDSGEKLATSFGDNNRLRITVPEFFNGRVVVSFCEPFLWKLSELVSLISILGTIIYYSIGQHRKVLL